MRFLRQLYRNRRAPRSTRRTRPRATLGLEALESRVVLYSATGNAWPNPQVVTISFMPDGTNINGNASNLNASFNGQSRLAGWQNQILAAAQAWAQQTNVNFAVVPDDGAPAGSGNYQQGDPGFGDIRIGGYAFGNTVLATASQPPPANNYSAAGDITFNTGQSWSIGQTFDLFTVAVHEFGHALGMGHSSSSDGTVMYPTYVGKKTQLSPDDIAGIRSVYSGNGARSPDAYEAAGQGTSFASAVDVTATLDPNFLSTVVPNLDNTTTLDAEFYKVTVPAGSSGSMAIAVQSAGLSLLAPKFTVFASDQKTILGVVNGGGQYGTTIATTIAGVAPGQQFYVEVQGADLSQFGTGKYDLSVDFGTASPPSAVADDGGPSFAQAGSWTTVGGAGYNGDYLYAAAGTGTSTATWTTSGLAIGTYDVETTWTPYSNRADNASYQIYDGNMLVKTVAVNQRLGPSGVPTGGSSFQSLGTVTVSSGTLRVVLGNNADGYVVADAVRVAPTFPAPAVTDNDNVGSGYAETGSWTSGGGAGFNLDYRFAAPTSGPATATAAWTTPGLAPGSYEVDATWASFSNRADNASYQIYDGNMLVKTVLVNQQLSPQGPLVGTVAFQNLGTVTVSSGTLRVVLGNNADGYVVADAVRVAPSAPAPAVTDNDSPGGVYAEAGSWTPGGGTGYNNDYRFAAPTSGPATATATWTTPGLAPGPYEVDVSWVPYSNRADNAPFQIYDGNTLVKTLLVNEQVAAAGPTAGGVAFQSLGTVTVSSGTLRVVLGNNADGYVVADAVRVAPSIAIPSISSPNGNPFTSGGGSADSDELLSAVPTILGISPDAGSSTNDGVTDANKLTVSGIAEAGDTVSVSLDGTLLGTAIAQGNDTWSYDASKVTIPDGTHAFTAAATDAMGYVSGSSFPYAVVVDTQPPPAPTIVRITPDTGISASDGITSNTDPTLVGTSDPSNVINLSVNGKPFATTIADINGNWSYTPPGATLPDGRYVITATGTDVAGNTGPASAAFVVTIMAHAPQAPVVAGISPDTGSSSSDGVTRARNLKVSGTAPANLTIQVSLDGIPVGTTTSGGNGNWTFDDTNTTLADGNYAFTATAIDAAGNAAASSPFAVVVDRTANPPAIAGAYQSLLASATSSPLPFGWEMITVTGTAPPNLAVRVAADGSQVGAVNASGNGTWSFSYNAPISWGSTTIAAATTDLAGNVGTTSYTMPGGLSFLASLSASVASGSILGVSSTGQVTTTGTPTFAGVALPGTVVTVLDGNTALGTATVNSKGQWSFSAPALKGGVHNLVFESFDPTGTYLLASSNLSIRI